MGCGNVNTIENENHKNSLPQPNSNLNENQAENKKDKNIPKNINLQKSTKKNRKLKEKIKQEMKEYQKLIKRKRKLLKSNGEYEDSTESEDSRLKYAKGKKFGKKRKKLTPDEIEDGIKQDQKEEEKRKGRKAFFSPMQKDPMTLPLQNHSV